ncbi:DUF4129 domain-containing protein [Mucilaginibacter gossypiicola]|nr:DUF4129 domain-containing protein [Mucilaginibacter gossypiicola]
MPKPILIILMLLCLAFNPGMAKVGGKVIPVKTDSVTKKKPAIVRTDSSKVNIRRFNENALDKYRADKEYQYNDKNIGNELSFWDRFWNWFWRSLFGSLSVNPGLGTFLKYFFLILAVGALIYFVMKLLGMDMGNLLLGNSRKTPLAYTESAENIHEINFDEEIEKAISNHNYRLAVRLLYLRSLKQLSDNGLIQWQPEKTNSAYVYELNNPSVRQSFVSLTRQFEYVWYGGFNIDGAAFGNINQLFQNFKKQLL